MLFTKRLTLVVAVCILSLACNKSVLERKAAWIEAAIPANEWRGVACAPQIGLSVAVAQTGVGNRVAYSRDGTYWEGATTPADLRWQSVAWSPERHFFVAVAQTGDEYRVMTSPDGAAWTLRKAPNANDWRSVAWSSRLGIFVAVAQGGDEHRAMISKDGETWDAQKTPANQWRSVIDVEDLGLLIAVAQDGEDRIMTSADGKLWTPRQVPALSWQDAAWSPELGLIVAVAENREHEPQRIMVSTDGVTWSLVDQFGVTSFRSIAWSGDLFAAVGNNSENYAGVISRDGKTWNDPLIVSSVSGWGSICYRSDLKAFIVVGQGEGARAMRSR